ncbi:hypothetical protein [Rhodococcus spongiicola]|uniref:Uncharacterized protein n=1 Tax=Rhodococcus spongiicola TaxID=2487352 RepID=A0A438ASQ5_9NOCA|nr:hypothetical protein [Rhodococcus spongiicola]RVW01696.1 hypothetical protein EF834_14955 [Rhodococcus spongiicola]
MKSRKRVLGVVAAAGAMVLGFAPAHGAPGGSNQAEPDPRAVAFEKVVEDTKDPNSSRLERLSDADRELLRSSKLKSVLIDAATGAVLSVGEGAFVPEGAAPGAGLMVSVPGECGGPPQPCFNGSPNIEFAGTGDDYGEAPDSPGDEYWSWPNRVGYTGGPYDALACWYYGRVVCGAAVGPYGQAYINESVTGLLHLRW